MSNQTEQKRFIYDSLEFARGKVGLGALPSPHIATPEGHDTILLEWIQSDRRMGFNVEADPSESGWYVLVKQGDSPMLHHEWGHMGDFDADKMVRFFWGEP